MGFLDVQNALVQLPVVILDLFLLLGEDCYSLSKHTNLKVGAVFIKLLL